MSKSQTSDEAGAGRPGDARAGSHWRTVLLLLVAGAVVLWVLFVALGTLVVDYWQSSRFGRADGDVVEFLERERTPTGNTVSHVMVLFADTITVVALTSVIVVGVYLSIRRLAEPLFLAAAVIGETLIFTATTAVVNRDRPAVAHLDVSPPTSSFPSGHTAAAICLYGGIALLGGILVKRRAYRRLLWTIAIVIPLAVGFGRLYRGMHFPTDVAGSVVLGTLWLVWLKRIYPLGKDAARAETTRA